MMEVVVLLFGWICFLCDWGSRKIPHALCMMMMILIVVFLEDAAGWMAAGAGLIIAWGLSQPLQWLGAWGNGDVKMFMAFGVWLGPLMIVEIIGMTFVFTAFYGAAYLISSKLTNLTWKQTKGYLTKLKLQFVMSHQSNLSAWLIKLRNYKQTGKRCSLAGIVFVIVAIQMQGGGKVVWGLIKNIFV